MERIRRVSLRIGLRAAIVILLSAPAAASGASVDRGGRWASVGLGLSPSRYGADRNGSLVVTVSGRRAVAPRLSVVGRVAYTRFAAHEATVLSPVSLALRAHLSGAPSVEGGPYLEAGPVLCAARWRGAPGSKSALLAGVTAGAGTEILLSPRTGIDWGGAFVWTAAARDIWPDRLTRERSRDGMVRGYMHVSFAFRP